MTMAQSIVPGTTLTNIPLIESEIQTRSSVHKHAVKVMATKPEKPLNILAIGDSWFDYPLYSDTIAWLEYNLDDKAILLNLAHYGDATTNMLGVSKRKRLIEVLTNPEHGKFDAILVSGGGNDVAGDQFVFWLEKKISGLTPFQALDISSFMNVLDIVKSAYTDLIAIRDEYAPSATIFTHAYDFPVPSGIGVCGMGPWLKPSLEFKGWTDENEGAQITKDALTMFDALMIGVSKKGPKIVHVETQGTLNPATDWSNELHPTLQGFKKISAKFEAAIRNEFKI